jgi:hypothetical protein
MQIMGSFTTFNANAIWKAQAEGKHHLFAWLLIQYKIQTADMLLQKNWPCNPICPLCDRAMETEAHLCLHCVFTREVWDLVVRWLDGLFRFLSWMYWWRSGGIHLWSTWQNESSVASREFSCIPPGTFGRSGIDEFLMEDLLHWLRCFSFSRRKWSLDQMLWGWWRACLILIMLGLYGDEFTPFVL